MLLSYDDIKILIRDGVVQYAFPDNVNGSSLDICLGPELLLEVRPPFGDNRDRNIVSLRERQQPPMRRFNMHVEDGYNLRPGEFVLARSTEVFNLPLDISCEFKLKSSCARIGINQLTACWCDPGWHGSHMTLELTNVLRYHAIKIRPGDKIGQVVFFSHKSVPEERSYKIRGRYNNDKTVEGIKP